jgi:twitching motility protein PilT
LVFSTLHTRGAAATLERIIDVFPVNQQSQVRVQLSVSLQAIVAQQLLPTQDGKRAAAYEIMLMNPAIRNLVRDGKVYQIDNIIQTSAALGMRTMDDDILDLYRQHKISRETAIRYAFNPGDFENKL